MSASSITTSSRHLYCIPPHTHALLRYDVHSVTASHVAIHVGSGVTVDRISGKALGAERASRDAGPVRLVPRDRIDVLRSWEGVPPEVPVYYSSVEAYRRLHDLSLVRYGVTPANEVEEMEAELEGREIDRLRQRMMDAHPDHGGSESAFTAAREAYEAARRKRTFSG